MFQKTCKTLGYIKIKVCKICTYPAQYLIDAVHCVGICVDRVHTMRIDGAHCVGSILWLYMVVFQSN